MLIEQARGDDRGAGTEAAISFLQRDDVGVDLGQNVEDALRVAPAIGADPLAHVVARDLDLHLTGVTSSREGGCTVKDTATEDGAGCRNRTRDLRFTKPLLYQLS